MQWASSPTPRAGGGEETLQHKAWLSKSKFSGESRHMAMAAENKHYEYWSFKKDGASRICQLLFEEATDINFFVGKAINPAHQNPDLPINFNIKMKLVEDLSSCLKKMGKRIKVSYF